MYWGIVLLVAVLDVVFAGSRVVYPEIHGFTANPTLQVLHQDPAGVGNLMQCVRACRRLNGCGAVSRRNETCVYMSNLHLRLTTTDVSETIILVHDFPVVHVESRLGRYLLTYEEAEAMCQSLGGRVASRTEMQYAFNSGYHLCLYDRVPVTLH